MMGIIDLKERKSRIVEEARENKKSCTDCKTTKTPLWRGGPAGPKSLCNACGIRYRKKRRTDPNRVLEKKKEKSQTQSITSSSSENFPSKSSHENELSRSLKMRLFFLGSEVLLQTSSSSPQSVVVKKQRCQRRRKLGEEEQAAFSLMAMSSGAVFA